MFAHYVGIFFNDNKVHTVAILVALDLILGVMAAVKTGTFQLSYIAKFLHDDVLGKVVPFFVLYVAGKTAGKGVLIGGINFDVISDGAWVIVLAALTGSLLGSVSQLFPGLPVPASLGGGEKQTPQAPEPPQHPETPRRP